MCCAYDNISIKVTMIHMVLLILVMWHGVDKSTHEFFFFLFSFHKKRDEVNFDWSLVWILSNKKKTNQIFTVSYSFHEKNSLNLQVKYCVLLSF